MSILPRNEDDRPQLITDKFETCDWQRTLRRSGSGWWGWMVCILHITPSRALVYFLFYYIMRFCRSFVLCRGFGHYISDSAWLRRQKSLVYWTHYPNSTNVGLCSLSAIGMSNRPNRISIHSLRVYATSIATSDL